MLASRTRWRVLPADEQLVRTIAEEMKISPLLARLLAVRGLRTREQIERFFDDDRETCHDPFLLDGMNKAVQRIQAAVTKGEKIRVYGDYDADGVSGTALMFFLFKRLNARFDYYIPHRRHEGYGLNTNAVQLAAKEEVSLIVTVDNGISAAEEVKEAGRLGIDVIVTDHHEPPELLPEALAIINPKKPGCPYPFKQLAGAGVALKLAQALLGEVPAEMWQIAAIGTVADVMPLIDENRSIVKKGLQYMNEHPLPGIRALLAAAGQHKPAVTATHIGFSLAPRINAGGRMDHADSAVKMLTAEEREKADEYAAYLNRLNEERKKTVEEMTREALQQIAAKSKLDKVLVLGGENWNIGVLGIVAAKILEQFYRPVIVLSIDPQSGLAKGSARSIAGYDIHKALTACSELLDHFGGHQMAGGLTVRLENIAELSERLNRLADEWLTEDDFIPISVADSLVSVADIQLGTIEQMQSLAPFGEGNPPPRFIVKGCKVRSVAAMGQGKQHVKLLLSSAGDRLSATVEAVGFHMGALAELIAPDAECDIFGEMSANEWNGTKKPQILIHDVRVSRPQVFDWRHESGIAAKLAGWAETFKRYGSQTFLPGVIISSECLPAAARLQLDSFPLWALNSLGETRPANRQAEGLQLEKMTDVVFYSLPPSAASLESLLARLHSAERLFAVFQPLPPSPAEAMPSREAFKKVYVCLRDMGMLPKDGAAFQALGRKAGLPAESARWIVEVFAELKFVLKTEDGYEYVAAPERQNLQSSRMYRERLERMNAMELFVRSPSAELAEWLLARLRPVFNHENALEEWV